MKSLRYLILLVCVAGNLLSVAQKQVVIVGKVTDLETKQPVKDASIYLENKESQKVMSNRMGNFVLPITYSDKDNPVLVVKSVFYDIYKHKFSKSELRKFDKDTVYIDVALNWFTLPAFSLNAAPDTVFGSKEISVSDYEFHNDNFVMLVYEKRLEKGSKIVYVDPHQTILSTYTIPGTAKELYKDYKGAIYAICENKTYQIDIVDDVISLFPIENSQFENQIRPWVDTTENSAYLSNFVWYYPQFDYYAYNNEDTTFKKIYTVIDKPLMQLYRAQYKYVDGHDKVQAMKAEIATGIDKEIWIAIWTGFPNSLYYRQLYAPMFIKDDTLLIFDHYTNKMYRFDNKNQPIDSIEIAYHNGVDRKEWEELLVKDQTTQIIYSVFLRGGKYYLKELNTATGEINNVFKLTYKYPEKIKIKSGYAYYIYRPFESAQKKFLYKEKLEVLEK